MEKEYLIGSSIKHGRRIYTIVAIFEDLGEKFLVAKRLNNYQIDEYAHIFAFDENGRIYKHV